MNRWHVNAVLSLVLVHPACATDADEGPRADGQGSGSGCASLGERQCAEATNCALVYGSPSGDLSNDRVFVECRPSGDDFPLCHTVLTCAYPVEGPDRCMLFPDDCIPQNWIADYSCEAQGCPPREP